MKARIGTIITVQLAYDRCDNVIKTKDFNMDTPIEKIKDWIESIKKEQMPGTGMSNVCIEFMDEN